MNYDNLRVAYGASGADDHLSAEHDRHMAAVHHRELSGYHAPLEEVICVCRECGKSTWRDKAIVKWYTADGCEFARCNICAARTGKPEWEATAETVAARIAECERIRREIREEQAKCRG